MDALCVICGKVCLPHRYRRKEHKTCGKPKCMKAYRNQRASVRDIRTRAAQRAIDEQNGSEMVACAVCGERFEIIQHTHLKRHGLTPAQYKKQYPSAPLMTERMKELRRKGSIVQSRYLNYAGKEPDDRLFEFLTGALLGDGSLEKRPDKINARYAEGGKNELYLNWKYDLLRQYFHCSFTERLSCPHTKTGQKYHGWWLRTTVHPLLTEWHSQWYKERKKIVPQVLVETYLTEFALAVWFCDDGHSSKREHRSYLYTLAFSQEEVIFLSDLLKCRFRLENSIIKNKQGQPLIVFPAAGSHKIRELVAAFSIPGMAYKSQEPLAAKKRRRNRKSQEFLKSIGQEVSEMTDMQTTSTQQRTVTELVEDIEMLTKEIQELYCQDEIPFVLGWSGGKDSTAVLQLIWYAIAALPPEKRTKTIHVITTDTLVENPIVAAWVQKSHQRMKSAAQEQGMPIEPHLLYPKVKDTFWVCLIGKGYPAPRQRFRWCTDRLKIQPANHYIRNMVRDSGEVILVLGMRKAESTKRAATMEKHEQKRVRDRLSPRSSLINSLVYTPIEDWRNDEVWLYLMQWPNPWGQSNKELLAMYRGATADNECPLVVDTSTPSCGDSRFGCWVCTMVSKDKSMEAMIQNDEEKEWMQPLLNIRNELDIENDRDKRDFRRIWGDVQLFERNVDGEIAVEPIPGPYTKYWREHWLRRVLEAQTQIRQTGPEEMRSITLITQEELSEIRRIWLEEKHEFDDSLPRIYEEVTGEPFKDPRPSAGKRLLGHDEWEVLEEICDGDAMHLELMSKLLNTERQFRTKARRTGLYDELEKCFETSSRSKEEAIKNAHLKRDLKTAAGEGNVEKVKQLTWASLKFPTDDSGDENPDN